MMVSRHAVVAVRGSRGLVVTGAACCRRKQDGRVGSRRRSSAPDAPQWRPCGTADSAGAGRGGGEAGGQIQVRARLGEPRLSSPEITQVLTRRIYETLENKQQAFNSGGKCRTKINVTLIQTDTMCSTSGADLQRAHGALTFMFFCILVWRKNPLIFYFILYLFSSLTQTLF